MLRPHWARIVCRPLPAARNVPGPTPPLISKSKKAESNRKNDDAALCFAWLLHSLINLRSLYQTVCLSLSLLLSQRLLIVWWRFKWFLQLHSIHAQREREAIDGESLRVASAERGRCKGACRETLFFFFLLFLLYLTALAQIFFAQRPSWAAEHFFIVIILFDLWITTKSRRYMRRCVCVPQCVCVCECSWVSLENKIHYVLLLLLLLRCRRCLLVWLPVCLRFACCLSAATF